MTIVDGHQVIIGFYPKKLIPALKLEAQVDLSSSAGWVADKYHRILGAAIRATCQLTDAHLDRQLPWRAQSLRDLMVHVLSFPELAWLSHRHGSMTTEDMAASTQRLKGLATADAIAAYGEGVRRDVAAFLESANEEAFQRVVPAHYGGEVTVLELLNIILRHSTHHLMQAYSFMEQELGVSPQDPATEEDREGIATPEELI